MGGLVRVATMLSLLPRPSAMMAVTVAVPLGAVEQDLDLGEVEARRASGVESLGEVGGGEVGVDG